MVCLCYVSAVIGYQILWDKIKGKVNCLSSEVLWGLRSDWVVLVLIDRVDKNGFR